MVFAALAYVGPPKARNIAVSFSAPIAFLMGGRTVPTVIDAIGDTHSFGLGISLTGCLILAGAFLTCLLKFSGKGGTNGS